MTKEIQRILEKQEERVFLIGAGASIASHLPDGRTMVEHILSDLVRSFKEHYGSRRAYRDQLDSFEKNADRYKNRGMTGYQAIMCAMRDVKGAGWIATYIRRLILDNARRPEPDRRWIINNCYNILANIATEQRKFARAILTTNFDPLLYYAFVQNWDTEPVLIRHYHELDSMVPTAVKEDFPCLMYLHGYWQNHQVYNDPGQFERYRNRWVSRLSQHDWVRNDVIVVGYSGLEDNIAQRWLKRCLKNDCTIWWCLYRPANRQRAGSKVTRRRRQPALPAGWPDRWMPRQQMTPTEEEDEIRRMLGRPADRLHFVPVESADDFALRLGCHPRLNLLQARRVSAAVHVADWFRPNDVSQFGNGAKLVLKIDIPTDGIVLGFQMGSDTLPGNNHAGINIDTVEHEINLKREVDRGHRIRVYYTLLSKSNTERGARFEFKLHSRSNAWSALLPLQPASGEYTDIPLREFAEKGGLDLKTIWRIVIAADVKGLGIGGSARIQIQKTRIVPPE